MTHYIPWDDEYDHYDEFIQETKVFYKSWYPMDGNKERRFVNICILDIDNRNEEEVMNFIKEIHDLKVEKTK